MCIFSRCVDRDKLCPKKARLCKRTHTTTTADTKSPQAGRHMLLYCSICTMHIVLDACFIFLWQLIFDAPRAHIPNIVARQLNVLLRGPFVSLIAVLCVVCAISLVYILVDITNVFAILSTPEVRRGPLICSYAHRWNTVPINSADCRRNDEYKSDSRFATLSTFSWPSRKKVTNRISFDINNAIKRGARSCGYIATTTTKTL